MSGRAKTATPLFIVLMLPGLMLFGLTAAVMSTGIEQSGAAGNAQQVFAWGDNGMGDLGLGSESNSVAPMPVKGLSGATAVTTAEYQGLALMGNGTVKAWGDNTDGELGDDTKAPSKVPVPINGLSGVTAVSAGLGFDVALLGDGTVDSWGNNLGGQLGNGVDANVSHQFTYDSPAPVVGLTGVTAISAGTSDSLALLGNGTVMSWGVFDTEATPGHNVALAVQGLSGVKAVAAGLSSNYALLANGTVMTWPIPGCVCDTNLPGTGASTPTVVAGLSNVMAISAGQHDLLALLQDGTVMASGENNYGQLGVGGDAPVNGPVAVHGLSKVTAVSAGGDFGLALLSNGSVKSWGEDTDGDLGNGKISHNSNVPVTIPGLSGVHTIAAGTAESFATQAMAKATSTSTSSSAAPCTAAAITAAIKAHTSNFHRLDGFGCSGQFAYAFVTVTDQQGNPIAEVTDLLMASGKAWQSASRDLCQKGSVPAAIYQNACQTN
jgi:alpha-tubulin suppressor-like RCC1 family protein